MRLCPPVPSLLPREVLAGDIDVDGVRFPAGTVVGVPIYALHHNAEYHPDPFRFDPTRWMGDDEKASGQGLDALHKAQSAFCPFSVGPRGCIGKGVAYLELTVALARTLWLYDLRLVGEKGMGPDGQYEVRDIFVAEKEGPLVQFRRRVL